MSLPDFLTAGLTGPLPFLYESSGIETFFRDARDPAPRSRRVFAFHRPETLGEWIVEPDTLRRRLTTLATAHPLVGAGNNGASDGLGASPMRDCQIEAITGLEASFAENRPRALIHMATGAGKTYTACAFTYRLIAPFALRSSLHRPISSVTRRPRAVAPCHRPHSEA